MSNILIIKHGSLGDLIQANGAMEDIKRSKKRSNIVLLTSNQYFKLMSKCPYVDKVIVDERLPRWNLFYLHKLKKRLSVYNFTQVFDLQNSSRTKFYRKYILKAAQWSSTETTLETDQLKSDFDREPVLDRMEVQLKKSGIKTESIRKSNLNWAVSNIRHITKNFISKKYILIFPFCSAKLISKKWPFYSILISQLKAKYSSKYDIVIAPGPNEIEESKLLNAQIILNKGKFLEISELISLIKDASFIVSNDTGPAHICSHMNKHGIVLFGSHTSARKVSIESEKFKPLSVKNLNLLKTETVMEEIKKVLN
ncbi:lipopolysaccharide heptosyltransferase family protein [Pelagibacteraceae bacterium]|nr:lipopolysaccharide heptosyltransferase family protein [Pelagibacteraceae bacterium]